jgi:hypothetical protein
MADKPKPKEAKCKFKQNVEHQMEVHPNPLKLGKGNKDRAIWYADGRNMTIRLRKNNEKTQFNIDDEFLDVDTDQWSDPPVGPEDTSDEGRVQHFNIWWGGRDAEPTRGGKEHHSFDQKTEETKDSHADVDITP